MSHSIRETATDVFSQFVLEHITILCTIISSLFHLAQTVAPSQTQRHVCVHWHCPPPPPLPSTSSNWMHSHFNYASDTVRTRYYVRNSPPFCPSRPSPIHNNTHRTFHSLSFYRNANTANFFESLCCFGDTVHCFRPDHEWRRTFDCETVRPFKCAAILPLLHNWQYY